MTNAFLAISIGSPYYSRERIRHHLSWARVNYESLAFLVGDRVARYTFAATRNLDLLIAEQRVVQIGDNVCSLLSDVCVAANAPAEIFRWGHLEAMPEYARLLRPVEDLDEFMAIYAKEYGVELSRAEASEIAFGFASPKIYVFF